MNTTHSDKPAAESTERSPRCWGYFCLWPDDEPSVRAELKQEAESHFRTLQTNGRLSGIKWAGCISDIASEWRTSFFNRPQGSQLDYLLAAGDVVVFASVNHSAKYVIDLLKVICAWDRRGIRVLFADELLARGECELSEEAVQKSVLMAAKMCALMSHCRGPQRRKKRRKGKRRKK